MRVLSLFSGIGGFEKGLGLANINHSVEMISELCSFAREAYLQNFKTKQINTNIKKLDENDAPDHDLLVGGFPCQTFSIAGKRRGFLDETKGTLFFDICRILKVKKPKFFILENVKNLVSHDNSNTIKVILNHLSDLGYSIDFDVLNAKDSGVPQARERTFIVGIKDYKKEPLFYTSKFPTINEIKNYCNINNLNTFNFFSTLKQDFSSYTLLKDILKSNESPFFYCDKNSTGIRKEYYNTLKSLNIINDTTLVYNIKNICTLPKKDIPGLKYGISRKIYSIYGISPTLCTKPDDPRFLKVKDNDYIVLAPTPEERFYICGYDKEFYNNIAKLNYSNSRMAILTGNTVVPQVIRDICNHFKNFSNFKNI